MNLQKVAATLYTTRDYQKTAAEIKETLKKIRAIGFPAVQVSGVGSFDYAELATMIRDEDLTCCATHESPAHILEHPEEVVERLKLLQCHYTAFPHPGPHSIATPSEVMALASKLNQSGRVLNQSGQVLTYHNHALEFYRLKNGKTVFESLVEQTNPEFLKFELDTHWVAAGGIDPAQLCQRLPNRLPLLHMKDFTVNIRGERCFAEIGSGNLDWKTIVDGATKAGCQWFIVEMDSDWVNGNPFDSLQKSFEYLQKEFIDG